MSHLVHKVHRKLHFLLKKGFYKPNSPLVYDLEDKAASDAIVNAIRDDNDPFMIARFGIVEMNVVLIHFYKNYRSLFNRFYDFYTFKTDFVFYDDIVSRTLQNSAGFFPLKNRYLDQFGELYLESSKSLNILASFPWVYRKEQLLRHQFFPDSLIINAEKEFEPFNGQFPWTISLKEKRVLVIHPFEESIREQYRCLDMIFPDKNILPTFELITLKAVQSILGSPTGYQTWFEAYDSMCEQIDRIDFDIAILGCGAYGFPLASYIKKMGKKAIHLGGATQVLFGIKGNRFDKMPSINKYYNEYWVRPKSSEIVPGHERIEDGCYW